MGLRYLATGAQLSLLADTQGRCVKSCLSTNINNFIKYCAAMSAQNVRFPEVGNTNKMIILHKLLKPCNLYFILYFIFYT